MTRFLQGKRVTGLLYERCFGVRQLMSGMIQYHITLLLGGYYGRTTKDFGDAESP